MYFVYTRRRDSKGRLIEGQWMGIQGWRQGLKGPLTKTRAQEIQAQVGAEIIPVEIEDFDSLIRKAFKKAGVEPPQELIDALSEEEEAEEEDDEDVEALQEEVLGVDGPEEDESVEEEETLEDTIQPETPAETEEAEDGPEWPGYNEAIEIMNEHDFDWMDAGGGRKTANVKDAWEEFGSQFE